MATVLITGSNRGIGLGYVKQYLADGANVIATARDPKNASALTALLATYATQLRVMPLDVDDDNSIAQLAVELADEPIDILISNAGVYGPYSEIGDNDANGWMDTLRTNVIGPMHVVEKFVNNLRAGREKKLVLMSSKMGSMEDNGSGGSYIYRSSKAALNAVGKSLANDLLSESIIVLIMHPGWVRTDMTGPNAPTSVEDSVAGLRQVIAQASLAQSGRFWAYDGKEIPW